MIENLPLYIVVVFILTTLLTVGIFYHAVKRAEFNSSTSQVISFFLPFWLLFQATAAITGFYQKTDTLPPRIFIFAFIPATLGILSLFYFSAGFIEKLSLRSLTFLSIIRIPVEVVLFWLFQSGQIPQVMTFEGRNFDLLSGITAPIVAWLAFRNKQVNRPLLIIWNIAGLILLINIVFHAALSIPSAIQQFGLAQPNRAVLYFPFIWLPSTVVPIVFFTHLAALWQLFFSKVKI